jgi:hypothetical protein
VALVLVAFLSAENAIHRVNTLRKLSEFDKTLPGNISTMDCCSENISIRSGATADCDRNSQ